MFNDDSTVYDTIDGYDFNNSLFMFKINNFVVAKEQYGVIFDNIYQLRLLPKTNEMNVTVFNLQLINKLLRQI